LRNTEYDSKYTDLGGTGRGLFQDIIHAFAQIDSDKTRISSS